MKTVPLNVTLNSHGLAIPERERRHIDNGLSRLDSWTKRFPERSVQLNIKQHERDGVHTINLVLELPNKTIVAHDSAPWLLAAVDRAFRKAGRQLQEFKSQLRREHLHRRVRDVRVQLPEIPEAEVSQVARKKDLAEFRERVRSHVSRLRRFLQQEVAHLPRNRVAMSRSIDDLVEDTIADALERFHEKPWALPVTSWLYSVAMEVLERTNGSRREATIAIEGASDVPEPPSDDDLYDGLHRLLFRGELREDGERTHVPQREPRILVGSVADPAATAEEHDLQDRVTRLLADLPALWRRSFLLHFVEGFDHQEIAQILSLSEDQVRFNIQSTELFLHERLAESY
jgi:ribosomal subunit interface protein